MFVAVINIVVVTSQSPGTNSLELFVPLTLGRLGPDDGLSHSVQQNVFEILEPHLDPKADSAVDTSASSHPGLFALSLSGPDIKTAREYSLLADTPRPLLERKQKATSISLRIDRGRNALARRDDRGDEDSGVPADDAPLPKISLFALITPCLKH
jgi:hypothetical protein